MRKLAVARLWYEGNSFSPIPSGLPVFEFFALIISVSPLTVTLTFFASMPGNSAVTL